MTRLVVVPALLAVLGLPMMTSGHAKEASKAEQTIQKLKKDCKSDLKKYCGNVTPGEGRIAACMNSVEDKLSPVCKSSWTGTQARVSEKMDKADVAFRKDCGADVQKFCADVPSGRGRLLDCLNQHSDALSGSCKDFQARLQQRVDEMFG